jgi:hypothetical protein
VTKKVVVGRSISEKDQTKELEKLLRLAAYHILTDLDEGVERDIDEILGRPVLHGSITDVDIDLDDADFWQNLLERPESIFSDSDVDDVCAIRDDSDREDVCLVHRTGDGVRKWSQSDLGKLHQLLFFYGWGRWDEGRSLCELNCNVSEVKLAGRAILHSLINATEDLNPFSYSISLLEGPIRRNSIQLLRIGRPRRLWMLNS